MKNKFRIRVTFIKRVASPEFGPNAYHYESHSREFTYGKGKDYKSSKEGVADLKKLCSPFIGYFNEIEIWVLRGYGGTLAERIRGTVPEGIWDDGIDKPFCEKILNRCYEEWPYCDSDPEMVERSLKTVEDVASI